MNLDEGTVLAFICQCSSDCPVISSQSCAGENANRPGPSSHRKHGGSTEATGPLSLSTADAIACDVGHFVFCGLVGSKDRPKKTQDCTPDGHRTQLKGLQVMLSAWGQSVHQTFAACELGGHVRCSRCNADAV